MGLLHCDLCASGVESFLFINSPPFLIDALFSHPSKHVNHAFTNESTGNLNWHIQVCTPVASAESQKITKYAQGVNYSYTQLCFLLTMWIVRCHHPFTMVEDPEFQEILKMLYMHMDIPLCVTILCNLKDIFNDSHMRVKDKLQVHNQHSCDSNDVSYIPINRTSLGRSTSAWMVGLPLMSSLSSA